MARTIRRREFVVGLGAGLLAAPAIASAEGAPIVTQADPFNRARASKQDRQQTEQSPQHRQGDARIYAVELLGHDGRVDQANVFTAR